ncbi:MAG: hypothetical protein ACKODQ_00995 [Betaproteobacteria bacterium]
MICRCGNGNAAAALATEAYTKFSEGRPAKKVIVVAGRLVNIVV